VTLPHDLGTTPDHPSGVVPSVRGIVWDLGNVVVDWDPLHAIAAGVGEEQARAFLEAVDFMAWNHGPDSGDSWDDAQAWLEREHPEWAAAGRAYRAHFPASLLGPVPGTSEVVRELHAAGVRQVGLTNWSDELYHAHAPRLFPVLALLDPVVVSGTEGVAKPDPGAYAIAVERAGLPAAELVFVDDRASNVEAAVACGLQGLVFTDADTLRADLRALGLPV
jgi:2-haloacid dehalogenase